MTVNYPILNSMVLMEGNLNTGIEYKITSNCLLTKTLKRLIVGIDKTPAAGLPTLLYPITVKVASRHISVVYAMFFL